MSSPNHVERLTTVDETGRGTPASSGDEWSRTFPTVDLTELRDVAVVAPHPDDEVLGVGAQMDRLASPSARVRVVAVTDGEAAYPLSPTLGPRELATVRVEESERPAALLSPGVTCLVTWSGDGRPDHEAVGREASAACLQTGATLLTYPVWTDAAILPPFVMDRLLTRREMVFR